MAGRFPLCESFSSAGGLEELVAEGGRDGDELKSLSERTNPGPSTSGDEGEALLGRTGCSAPHLLQNRASSRGNTIPHRTHCVATIPPCHLEYPDNEITLIPGKGPLPLSYSNSDCSSSR